MQLLLYLALLIAGGLLNYILKPNAAFAYKLAWAYLFLALFLSTHYWLYYYSGIDVPFVLNALATMLNWGQSLGHIILGYLVINLLFALMAEDEAYPVKKMINTTLIGVSILAGNTFLIAAIDMNRHICTMMSFFSNSGYAIWFLYFIMIAEILGGLGVLLHFKLKTGPVAAAGLMLIMIGALYTHCHNKEPLSDSYAALEQFITLGVMQVIYYFEQRANPEDQKVLHELTVG